jgi:sterol desaturase/sphingolipid hydroxylase (fatty acid hydroxylase superfamily)
MRIAVSQHVAAMALWPAIVMLPLALYTQYARVFPQRWYEPAAEHKPLGLSLGILAVGVGQVWVLLYQATRYHGRKIFGPLERVQPNEERPYGLAEGVATHLAQPEGFVLLGLYLAVTWLMGWMPPSYYSFGGGISWWRVLACLLVQDAVQCGMHLGEHKIHAAIYRASHKPHHRFTNPRLFDAFNGSVADTVLMILIPLYVTANIVSGCNVWDYMCFGAPARPPNTPVVRRPAPPPPRRLSVRQLARAHSLGVPPRLGPNGAGPSPPTRSPRMQQLTSSYLCTVRGDRFRHRRRPPRAPQAVRQEFRVPLARITRARAVLRHWPIAPPPRSHLFMYWDRLLGTYKEPSTVRVFQKAEKAA